MTQADKLSRNPDEVNANELSAFVEPLLILVAELTGMESSYLTRIDAEREEQQVLLARNAGELVLAPGLIVPWGDTLCRRALESRQESTSDVASTWPDAKAAIEMGIKSLVTMPVRLDNGQLWGTLCSASAAPIDPDDHALALMRAAARLVAQQVELVRRAHVAEQSLGRMAMVAEVSRVCLDAEGLGQAVSVIADRLQNFRPWRRAVPFVFEGDHPARDGHLDPDELALVEAAIEAAGDLAWKRHDEDNSPLLAAAAMTPAIRSSRSALGRSAEGPTALLTAATPLLLQAGVVLLADDKAELEDRDEQMLASCSNAMSLLADRLFHHGALEARNRKLHQEAGYDALTGLPNRRQLIDRLEQLLVGLDHEDQQLLVAFVDLDGFKKINDQHGHEAGDLFLISIANRLRQSLRSDDWVARLGGDEFVVVTLSGKTRSASEIARHLTERIDRAIVGMHDLGSIRLHYAGASIGVVAWAGESVADLLKRADEAMYASKRRRRGQA
jgi:diguanylate cyclase (GGDEF)-like protein